MRSLLLWSIVFSISYTIYTPFCFFLPSTRDTGQIALISLEVNPKPGEMFSGSLWPFGSCFFECFLWLQVPLNKVYIGFPASHSTTLCTLLSCSTTSDQQAPQQQHQTASWPRIHPPPWHLASIRWAFAGPIGRRLKLSRVLPPAPLHVSRGKSRRCRRQKS